jgi:hypothetical protein
VVVFASIPSEPGNPQYPIAWVIGSPFVSFTHAFPSAIAGSTYFVPKSAL